jgi:hypothetical protein
VNRNLLLLTLCQGLFFTNNVTFVAVNGLVGLQIAPRGWMATLPLTAYVSGSVAIQPRWRRRGWPGTSAPMGGAAAFRTGCWWPSCRPACARSRR